MCATTTNYVCKHVRESKICANARVAVNCDGVIGNGNGVVGNGDGVVDNGDVAVKRNREGPTQARPRMCLTNSARSGN